MLNFGRFLIFMKTNFYSFNFSIPEMWEILHNRSIFIYNLNILIKKIFHLCGCNRFFRLIDMKILIVEYFLKSS